MGWRETLQEKICEAEKAGEEGEIPVTLHFRHIPFETVRAMIGTVNARPIGDLGPHTVLWGQTEASSEWEVSASVRLIYKASGWNHFNDGGRRRMLVDEDGNTAHAESDLDAKLDLADQ
jgi:hypothetical protein